MELRNVRIKTFWMSHRIRNFMCCKSFTFDQSFHLKNWFTWKILWTFFRSNHGWMEFKWINMLSFRNHVPIPWGSQKSMYIEFSDLYTESNFWESKKTWLISRNLCASTCHIDVSHFCKSFNIRRFHTFLIQKSNSMVWHLA